jgi:hypothetical protein
MRLRRVLLPQIAKSEAQNPNKTASWSAGSIIDTRISSQQPVCVLLRL